MTLPTDIKYKNEIVYISSQLIECRQYLIEKTKTNQIDATANLLKSYLQYEFGVHFSCDVIYREISTYFDRIKQAPHHQKLIPYALEIMEYTYSDFLSAERDRRDGIKTEIKKKRGIYYTPSDVINRMTNYCLNSFSDYKNITFIDYSCGSGLFLTSLIEKIIQQKHLDPEQFIDFIEKSIFGVDISDYAIICTKFNIVLTLMRCGIRRDCLPQLSVVLDRNITIGDGSVGKHPSYPEKKFSCIIGNPPYITTSDGNAFLPFVYNLIENSEKDSICTLIVPLSLMYNSNSKYQSLRAAISADNAQWTFENYDRSPDSLFGDDVKTRNTILYRNASKPKLYQTTGLLRWSSSNRFEFLSKKYEYTQIEPIYFKQYIPKINCYKNTPIFEMFTKPAMNIGDLLSKSTTDYPVFIKRTAYNWIQAYDALPKTTKNGIPTHTPGYSELYVNNDTDQYFILALLNSTIIYWLWITLGDGFHVNLQFIKTISIESINVKSKQQMSALGRQLEMSIKENSKMSSNAGLFIESYSPEHVRDSYIKAIDAILISETGLPSTTLQSIYQWYSEHTKCGRDNYENK